MADEAIATRMRLQAQATWPQALCRDIDLPFVGMGARWDDSIKRAEELAQLDEQLGQWTRAFPTLTFVRLSAVCFGGRCDYGGTVWRNGQSLLHEDDWSDDVGDAPLLRLLEYLGVTSGESYFEPFSRGYFKPQG